MQPHANYVAVIGLSQQALQDMIRSLYLANKIPHFLNYETRVQGFLEIKIELFNDAPDFNFVNEHSDSFLIQYRAWGTLTIALPSLQDGNIVLIPETRDVLFEAEILVPHDINIQGTGLLFGIIGVEANLISYNFTVLAGEQFSQQEIDLLDSTIFHTMLEQAIRENLETVQENLPAIDIGFLEPIMGSIIVDEQDEEVPEVYFETTAKIIDGALMIGIDKFWNYGLSGTFGNKNLLTNNIGGMGIGLWINPDIWIPMMRDQFLGILKEEAIAIITNAVREALEEDENTDIRSIIVSTAEKEFDDSLAGELIAKRVREALEEDEDGDIFEYIRKATKEVVEERDIDEGVRTAIKEQDAELDYFNLQLKEGYLHVSGKAIKEIGGTEAGSVTFSFDIYPKLERPARTIDLGNDELGNPCRRTIPSREELWFDVSNISIELHRSGRTILVEIILGIISAGILAGVIEMIMSIVEFNVYSGIHSEITTTENISNNRIHEFRISNDAPPIRAYIEKLDFHEYGIFAGLSLNVLHPVTGLRGFWLVDVNDALRNTNLTYRIQLPIDVHPEDPNLRIRWTVRNVDRNTILLNLDNQAKELLEITLNDYVNALELLISCRVYRTLGAMIVDFYNGQGRVYFHDRLDRSKPYVQWYHYVYTPDVRKKSNGILVSQGGHIKYRRSKIHRTDFPERCHMVGRYSLGVPSGYRYSSSKPPKIIYMGSLPFPRTEINNNRHKICEYCFFGDPQSTKPKPFPTD